MLELCSHSSVNRKNQKEMLSWPVCVNSLRTTTVDTDGNITKRQLLRNRNVALLQDMSQEVM